MRPVRALEQDVDASGAEVGQLGFGGAAQFDVGVGGGRAQLRVALSGRGCFLLCRLIAHAEPQFKRMIIDAPHGPLFGLSPSSRKPEYLDAIAARPSQPAGALPRKRSRLAG